MKSLPQNSGWKSAQNGDTSGSLIRSKNISLDKQDLVALARKAMVLYSLSDDAGFGTPTVIETDGTYLYVVTADGHFFVVDLTSNSFSILEASATNGPTLGDDSDMVIFNSKPHVTGGTKLNYITAGQGQNWHSPAPITDLTSGMPHPLCVYENKKTLLVGDGNIVRQYSTAYSRDSTNELVIPEQFIVTSIRYRLGKVYIGTRHRYGGQALLFEWNGAGASAQQGYPTGSDWIYSQEEYQSSIAIITSAGQIKRFNGGGFDVVVNLPVYYTPYQWTLDADDSSLIGKVASRGMRAVGDKLYINIDGSLNNPASTAPGMYLPEQPSGLWVLDPNAGLHHKAGYNYQNKILNTILAAESSYLTFGTAHQAKTGDPVLYVGALSGLVSGQVYYALVDTPTSVRLALTPQDAVAGKWLSVTGTPTSDRCYFDRYESMGASAISAPGGVCVLGRNHLNPFYAGDVLFGGAAFDSTLEAKGVLMGLGMGRNVSSFVTPQIHSASITDLFQRIAARFDPLCLDADVLVLKARTRRKYGLTTRPITITWISTTTFSVDSMAYDFASPGEGDEVEVIAGAGAGYTAHITAIDKTTSLYTVTIDEALPVTAADTALAFVDNWAKLTVLTKDSTLNAVGIASVALGASSPWAQVKVELRGLNAAIRLLQFIQSTNQPGV